MTGRETQSKRNDGETKGTRGGGGEERGMGGKREGGEKER